MANISSATVRVRLWSDLGEQIPFSFKTLKAKNEVGYINLLSALDNVSYAIRVYEEDGDDTVFLGGRWSFGANLEWKEEVDELYKAFVNVEPNTMTVELDVFDCDECNDWWETYKVLITEGGKITVTNEVSGDIEGLLDTHKQYITDYNLSDEDDHWSAISAVCMITANQFFASI